MTDELTPEERKALENLPRERMPIGLEGRVVEAMRESGFLARRRRAIEISAARAGGLLAACVALVIGAYSIGLYRGDNGPLRSIVETAKPNDVGRADAPASSQEAEGVALEKAPQPTQTQSYESGVDQERTQDDDRSEGAKSKKEIAASDVVETPAPAADAQVDAPASRDRAAPQSSAVELRAPSAARVSESAGRIQASLGDATSNPTLTFLMGDGTTWIVEAPDSVRVVQDEQGRMLLIYTSDGVIRIRLADSR